LTQYFNYLINNFTIITNAYNHEAKKPSEIAINF